MATNTDVLNRLITALTSNDPSWDVSVGTPEYKILEAVAQEIAIAANNNTLQNFSFDVTTKFGSDLDQFCALFGIYRDYGKRATGVATFSSTTTGTTGGTLTISGATGGTFNVNYVGSTVTLNYNASATAIQSAISSILPNGTTCTVTGTGPFTVAFSPALPPTAFSVNFAAITPTTASVGWVPNGGASSTYQIGLYTTIYAPSSATGTVPLYFQTTTPAQLQQGQNSVQVPIQAVLTGTDGNLTAGTITAFSSSLVGITQVTNSVMSGGTDAETDAQLQQRWQNTVFKNLAGTEDQFLALAYNNQDTTRAKVLGPQEINTEQLQILTSFNESTVTSINKSSSANPLNGSGNYYPFNSNQMGDGTSSYPFNFNYAVTVNATWTASASSQVAVTIPSSYASNSAGICQGMYVTVNGTKWVGWYVGSSISNGDGSYTVTLIPPTGCTPSVIPVSITAQTVSTPITFSFPLPNLSPWVFTSGTVTGSTSNTLSDSTASWAGSNAYANCWVYATSSTGLTYNIVSSNTTTTLTSSFSWTNSTPLTGSTYYIAPLHQTTPLQGVPTPSATIVSTSGSLGPGTSATLTLSPTVTGLPPTVNIANGTVRIFSGNIFYSLGYTGISGNTLTGVTASDTFTPLANDLVFVSSYNSATAISTIQSDLTNNYNNSPVGQTDQIVSVNATYNSASFATNANQGYISLYQSSSVYSGGFAVNAPPNSTNTAAYGALNTATYSNTVLTVNTTNTVTSSSGVTIGVTTSIPSASSTVGYPPSGVLWYYQNSTSTWYNITYTSFSGTTFSGCTLTAAFGASSFTQSSSGNDKVYLPNLQQAFNLLFSSLPTPGWETSVSLVTSAQGATSTQWVVNFYQKNSSNSTPMVPVDFVTVNAALVIQTANLSSSSGSGVAASWYANTKVADLINAQILLSTPSPANLTFNYTGTQNLPISTVLVPYNFNNTVSPVVPDPQYFYPQGLELVQSNYNATTQQSTASPNTDYQYVVTGAVADGSNSSLSVNILNGNNYSWLYPGNIIDLTYYYVALASRNNPTIFNTSQTVGNNPGTIATNFVDVIVDGSSSTLITESVTLNPTGTALTPGSSGTITTGNQTNWVLGDGVTNPSTGDLYYIFSQQPVVQPWTALYPNFLSLQQGSVFTPLYPYGGPINTVFPGGDPTYTFTTSSGKYNINPLSRISAIYYNMNMNLPEAFNSNSVVGSYSPQNKSITLTKAATTSGSYTNVVFNSDFYPIYDNTATAGSTLALNGIAIRQPVTRVDSSASWVSGSTTVQDSSAKSSDIGSFIVGTGIPTSTRIQNVVPGYSYTLSKTTTSASSSATIVRYAPTPTLVPVAITSIASTSTTMTVTAINTLSVGQQILISGNSNSNYNGAWTVATVTVLSGTLNSTFTVTGTGLSTAGGTGGTVSVVNSQLSNIQYYINSDVSATDTLVQQQRLVGVNTMTHQANFQQIMINLAVIVGNGVNTSSVYSSLQSQMKNYLNSVGYLQPIRTSNIIQNALQVTGVVDARLANSTDSKTYYGVQVVNPYAYYDSINDIATGGASNVDYRDIIVQSTSSNDVLLNSNQLPQLFRVNVYFRSQNDF